ncbi:MAG: hypothetical protein R2777_04160 [Chitinophagales bacterium]
MLDTVLGRWFSTDPVFQPWQSPYNSMDDNPILCTMLGDFTIKRARNIEKLNDKGYAATVTSPLKGGRKLPSYYYIF